MWLRPLFGSWLVVVDIAFAEGARKKTAQPDSINLFGSSSTIGAENNVAVQPLWQYQSSHDPDQNSSMAGVSSTQDSVSAYHPVHDLWASRGDSSTAAVSSVENVDSPSANHPLYDPWASSTDSSTTAVSAEQPSQNLFGTSKNALNENQDFATPAESTASAMDSLEPRNIKLFKANPTLADSDAVSTASTDQTGPPDMHLFESTKRLDADIPSTSASSEIGSSAAALKSQYPWYRTGDEIHDEIQSLASNCQGATLTISQDSHMNDGAAAGQQVAVDVVRVSKNGGSFLQNGGRKKKAMFVFGEHARELISPESGLQMLKTLCGQAGEDSEKELASRVLDHTDFLVLPNANPLSRKSVEDGEYCRRTNEDHVDLNRNFGDDHREDEQRLKGDEMDPGPRGFSEPESQMIRDLTMDEAPDIFLSVHAGAYLLGTPYGYTRDEKPHGEAAMLDVLRPISERFCDGDCPYGGLASLMSYKSKGSDIDWVKEQLDTPYVFTWEIYVGPNIRKYYAEEAHFKSEGKPMSDEARQFFGDDITDSAATLLQKSTRRQNLRAMLNRPEKDQDPSACFDQFNPESEMETQEVTHTWTQAFLTLCDEVDQRGLNKSGNKADKAASTTTADPLARMQTDFKFLATP